MLGSQACSWARALHLSPCVPRSLIKRTDVRTNERAIDFGKTMPMQKRAEQGRRGAGCLLPMSHRRGMSIINTRHGAHVSRSS